MSRSRWVFSLALCCLASIGSIVVMAASFVASGFAEIRRSAAAFVWSTIEPVLRSSSTPAYAGPSSIHGLRHEAGTSRRAADRHI